MLEQLGCKVDGVVVLSKFNVAAAARPPAEVQRKREPPVPGWGGTARIE